MNKKIAALCEQNNLQVIGNDAYGINKGYETNLFYNQFDRTPIRVSIAFYATEEQRQEIVNKISSFQLGIILTPSMYGISFGLNGLTLNGALKKLQEALDKIIEILNSSEVKGYGYCPLCGNEINEENKKTCTIAFGKITLEEACFNNINEMIKKSNEEFDKMPNNYLKGFAGVLLGALAGMVSCVIFFFLGFISAFSGFISIILGTFLYKKFGGKPNKMMIIMSCLVTIVAMALTVFVLYYLAATGIAYEQGLSLKGMEAFNYCMNETEGFKGEFTSNLIMILVFTLISCGYEVYALLRSIKRVNEIK